MIYYCASGECLLMINMMVWYHTISRERDGSACFFWRRRRVLAISFQSIRRASTPDKMHARACRDDPIVLNDFLVRYKTTKNCRRQIQKILAEHMHNFHANPPHNSYYLNNNLNHQLQEVSKYIHAIRPCISIFPPPHFFAPILPPMSL
jgi:hypothetical protein